MRFITTFKESAASRFLIVGLGLILILQSALIFLHFDEDSFDPLGEYPKQQVVNEVGRSGYPTVTPGEEVKVEATKCNDTKSPVNGFVSIRWISIQPRGSSIQVVTNSPTTIEPGCNEMSFSNAVPDGVVERNNELIAQGFEEPLWSIVGYEQPLDEDGQLGVGVEWKTEPFVLITQ